jgi:restriction endonuclease Mrr
MGLSFKQRNAVVGMAEVLADLLPYSGAYEHRGQVTYRSIAAELGLSNYWEKRSKRQGISTLIERILEYRRDRFEPFILKAVGEGLKYRQKEGRPIQRSEIEMLNGHILDVEFKFHELWDPDFLTSLEIGNTAKAKANVEQAVMAEQLKATARNARDEALDNLKREFYQTVFGSDRQAAGYALEKVLNQLFKLSGLEPREPFRVQGEQIDGSFCLDHEIYLVEAKWEKSPLSEAPLLVFRGKVEGKSHFTRGVFISLSGISEDARAAITRGKQPNFFIVDGHDVSLVLEGRLDLVELLRAKLRHLADRGEVLLLGKDLL